MRTCQRQHRDAHLPPTPRCSAANAITVRENEFDIGTAAINVNTQVISYVVIFRR